MPRIRSALAAVGLAAASLAIPLAGTPAAAESESESESATMLWNCRAVREQVGLEDGRARAFDGKDCHTPLGADEGNDYDWGDSTGQFQKGDTNAASSLMNNGYSGGRDVIAFYDITAWDYRYGYSCLAHDELFADDLSDNKFSKITTGPYTGKQNPMDNRISSHRWVTRDDCNTFVT
ncbi:hypothetical protein [Nonomuraea sp. LPB2021202275-12-8]|uniref:hypothetical protein n=1 Tax=Nonomuraea sp. LPB2021202275-12-8 TaxID=3120159 RepID=UPI00300D52B2